MIIIIGTSLLIIFSVIIYKIAQLNFSSATKSHLAIKIQQYQFIRCVWMGKESLEFN